MIMGRGQNDINLRLVAFGYKDMMANYLIAKEIEGEGLFALVYGSGFEEANPYFQ